MAWPDLDRVGATHAEAPPFQEHESIDSEPKICTAFRCVDCGEEKDGEYYMVPDELWAVSGMASDGGMLCLACLERRIGRLLVVEDFTALCPTQAAWQRHLAARDMALRDAVM